jgi:hypothetical protein
MKKNKIIYWTSTGLLALAMVASGVMYITSPQMTAAFRHLGFPDYFRIELGIAKILGSIAIILPMIPNKVKEWAYAGLSISFISAPIASYSVGDPIGVVVTPLFFLGILIVSYIYKEKMNA